MDIQGTTGTGISIPIAQSPSPLQNGPATPPLGGIQNSMVLQPSLGLDSITRALSTGAAFKNTSMPDTTVADIVKASLTNITTGNIAPTSPPHAVGATTSPSAVDATTSPLAAELNAMTSSAAAETPGQVLARLLSGSSATSNPLSQWQVAEQVAERSAASAQATVSQSSLAQSEHATQSEAITEAQSEQATQSAAITQVRSEDATQSATITRAESEDSTERASTMQAGQSQAAVTTLTQREVSERSAGSATVLGETEHGIQSAAAAQVGQSQTLIARQVVTQSIDRKEAAWNAEVLKQSALSTGKKGQNQAAAAAADMREEISNGSNAIGQDRRYLPFMAGNAKREAEAIRNGEILESLADQEEEPEFADETIQQRRDRSALGNPYDPYQNSKLAPLARKGTGQPFAAFESSEDEEFEREAFGTNRAGDPLKDTNPNTWRTAAASGRDGAFAAAQQAQNPALAPYMGKGVNPAAAAPTEQEAIVTAEEEAIVLEEVMIEERQVGTFASAATVTGGSSSPADAVPSASGFAAAQAAFQGKLSFDESTAGNRMVNGQPVGAEKQVPPPVKSMMESAAELMAFINQQKPQDIGGAYYGAEPAFGLRGGSRGRRGAGDDPEDEKRRERRNRVWAALAESRAERESEAQAKKEEEAAEAEADEKKSKRKRPVVARPGKKVWAKVPLTPKAPPSPPRARLPTGL